MRGIPLTYFLTIYGLCTAWFSSIAARFANEVESLFGSRLTLLLVAILNIAGLWNGLNAWFNWCLFALPSPNISRGIGSVILYDG